MKIINLITKIMITQQKAKGIAINIEFQIRRHDKQLLEKDHVGMDSREIGIFVFAYATALRLKPLEITWVQDELLKLHTAQTIKLVSLDL